MMRVLAHNRPAPGVIRGLATEEKRVRVGDRRDQGGPLAGAFLPV